MAIELTREIGRRITMVTEDTMETTNLAYLFQHWPMALRVTYRGRHAKIFGWAKSAAHSPRSTTDDAIDYVVFDREQ